MNISMLLLIMICFIGMISPGPDFILVTKNALLYPKRQALATALGIVTGCLFHATYCILGLALIITQSIVLYTTIKYAGACYLIYLGLKGLKFKQSLKINQDFSLVKNITVSKAYIEGVLCNALNPKLAVFLLSLFTQFVSIHASIGDKALVAGVFVSESALYWPLLVLFLQSDNVRKVFTRFQAVLGRVFGGLLVYIGIRVMLSAD
ncbi:LysE family translocator [Legionella anisa]|uniref:LysE family translocator n=2 Tax=Legionella anisa TaxID=28082 RepID=A0AAX0WQW4_9GAMM|nr:LysE family translocator [Legionella anisa]AWN75305.1 LysE family translocator [Legionella anisa]KTC72668.1 LysE type translocator [Legionella anisa]MBN5935485.1 LysE family translocator [Legionella anisa]MCW8424523.1 LysE family translocator [Legionella anisa]MCW8446359.1 LysE family translocator [Legionella anisa]